MHHTAEFLRERESRIYSRELCEVIFTRPYCRIANVEEEGSGAPGFHGVRLPGMLLLRPDLFIAWLLKRFSDKPAVAPYIQQGCLKSNLSSDSNPLRARPLF
jgi:hypothetical protein